MDNVLVGAGRSVFFFFNQPSSSNFEPITSIGRLPLGPGFSSNCFENTISNRRTPRCGHRSRYSPGRESDAGDKRIPEEEEDWVSLPSASPYQILGIDPASSSAACLRTAFRARVKKFHPDVYKGSSNPDEIILRVINAYEILSKHLQFESAERSISDPFEDPECEACDIFVNELQCVGRGCSYSCVKRAPHNFTFTLKNGTARAVSQDTLDDYKVQLAAGQCPRRCIHYVTSSQRVILQDVLERVLNNPFDMGETAFLESLISKAISVNRKYQKPKRKQKMETDYVDWS
ncbi:hypothetical protein KSP39_PZI007418 [Platanthera zijinensis]|uniref:J domain-containing protein n=1 Tax=Platanthera zijinensis TaxID=2320716 RepID=A0AAP0BPQ4_9ASPA